MHIWMMVIIVLGGLLAFISERILVDFSFIRPLLGVAVMLIAVGIGAHLIMERKGKKIEK